MNKQDIFNILKSRACRLTSIRKGIVECIVLAKRPVNEATIKKYLYNQKISCNRTTIYRELQFLTEQNIFSEIIFPDGVKRYEISQTEHHHHVICNKCKKIEPIFLDEKYLKAELVGKSPKGFTILGHSLEFFGLCQTCK